MAYKTCKAELFYEEASGRMGLYFEGPYTRIKSGQVLSLMTSRKTALRAAYCGDYRWHYRFAGTQLLLIQEADSLC